jgi:hypothetical protein
MPFYNASLPGLFSGIGGVKNDPACLSRFAFSVILQCVINRIAEIAQPG